MPQGVTLVLPLLGEGLRFRSDALSLLFVLLTLWVGFWATLFSFPYLSHGHTRGRFYLCWLLTLAGCLGSFLAADLFTLYLFFELMSLASWALVVHEEDYAALKAGGTYLYLSLAGGLALLAAAFLLQASCGTTAWQQLSLLPAPPEGILRPVASLLLAGFGLKAGVFPLHFWLPQAHPVAPAPASALLSGILLKVGAYGLLRTVSLLARWEFTALAPLGTLLALLAVFTMLLGAYEALQQQNAKRLLAFSSVSQLGYVVLGAALAALLAPAFPLVWAAALYHALNHALAKGALFLTAGSLGVLSGSLELSAAAGLGLRYRGLGAAVTLGAAAMAGLPGLSGYLSKTLLHHAVVAAPQAAGAVWGLLEPLFLLAGAGTVAYYLVFLTPWYQKSGARPQRAAPLLWLPPLVLTLSALAAGALPGLFLPRLVVPAALVLMKAEEAHHLAAELEHFHPWSAADLKGAIFTVALGLLVYAAYARGLLPRRRTSPLSCPRLPLAALLKRLGRSIRQALAPLAQAGRSRAAAFLRPLYAPASKLAPGAAARALAALAARLAPSTAPDSHRSDPLAMLLRSFAALGSQLRAAEELADRSRAHLVRRAVAGVPFPSTDYFLSAAGGLLLVTCQVLNVLDDLLNELGAALGRGTLALFRSTARLDEALENLSTTLARSLHSFLRRLGHLEAPPRPAANADPPLTRWERFLHLDLLNLDVAVLLLALLLILTLLYFLLTA
ncbi:complex I subunit 5 family protein [Gelria sp. Kuro-4]|uniref:complex I subunit 5 family protein n=1 Tax=Gelria sp. Kuro-4 TaxID=2796927 RepID=UPI001BEE5B8B|nr:complex I subunit 5 family protein [Gelria sp. Kuro-4]BCV25356.1 hypothetical protein kuro4_21290 [Gelria sp. Kuro-4]